MSDEHKTHKLYKRQIGFLSPDINSPVMTTEEFINLLREQQRQAWEQCSPWVKFRKSLSAIELAVGIVYWVSYPKLQSLFWFCQQDCFAITIILLS